jgi:hypothetical protein
LFDQSPRKKERSRSRSKSDLKQNSFWKNYEVVTEFLIINLIKKNNNQRGLESTITRVENLNSTVLRNYQLKDEQLLLHLYFLGEIVIKY